MNFRPCIDIHNGAVKQIVGSSLKDEADYAKENFVAEHEASYYAERFRKDELPGGHVILLNKSDSPYYTKTKEQALSALAAYPGGMMAGGGMRPETAPEFIQAGASHVIVTSYAFAEGRIMWPHIREMEQTVGREHLVLDLSCSRKNGQFFIMTDRWQNYTDTPLTASLMEELSQYCAEFLIHAIDVEGKAGGIDGELMDLISQAGRVPVTYAGGIRDFADVEELDRKGRGKVDFTIGSALDLYGGPLSYEDLVRYMKDRNRT